MIESPLITQLLAKKTEENIVLFLKERFGKVPAEVIKLLQSVTKEKQLNQLIQYAASCPDLDAFRERLLS